MLRGGTEHVEGIVGMGVAADHARRHRDGDAENGCNQRDGDSLVPCLAYLEQHGPGRDVDTDGAEYRVGHFDRLAGGQATRVPYA